MSDPLQHVQMALSQLAGLLVVIACVVLWVRRRSGWILLALIGECASLACSLAFSLAPHAFQNTRYLFLLWPLNALIFGAGLLGYACLDAPRRADVTPASGNPS